MVVGQRMLILGESGFLSRSCFSFFKESFDCRTLSYSQFCSFVASNSLSEWLLNTQPAIIVNCFGVGPSTFEFAGSIQGNLLASVYIVDALLKAKLPLDRFIFFGSAAEYGVPTFPSPMPTSENLHPVSSYGISKRLNFEFFKDVVRIAPQLNCVYLRPFNIIGPGVGDTTLAAGIRQKVAFAWTNQEDLVLNDWNLKRDFVDIDDVTSAVEAVIKNKTKASSFDVCSGFSTSLLELANHYLRSLQDHPSISIKQGEMTRHPIADIWGDTNPLAMATNWSPKVSLESSCRKFVRSSL